MPYIHVYVVLCKEENTTIGCCLDYLLGSTSSMSLFTRTLCKKLLTNTEKQS